MVTEGVAARITHPGLGGQSHEIKEYSLRNGFVLGCG